MITPSPPLITIQRARTMWIYSNLQKESSPELVYFISQRKRILTYHLLQILLIKFHFHPISYRKIYGSCSVQGQENTTIRQFVETTVQSSRKHKDQEMQIEGIRPPSSWLMFRHGSNNRNMNLKKKKRENTKEERINIGKTSKQTMIQYLYILYL